MIKVLNALSKELNDELKIPYEFDNWESELRLPYFVGEINENPTTDEDGKREFEFILTGEDVDSYTKLLEYSELIKVRYKYGHSIVLDNGLIKIIYGNTLTVPVEDEGIKRIQINITVYLWEDK